MNTMKNLSFVLFIVFSIVVAQPLVFSYEFTQETCRKGITPNLEVKDSLLLSTVTACVPGILEKVDEYKQIKCEEVVCTYEALKAGLDPGFCSKQAGYKTCRYVTGEIFAIPGINFVEQLREGIAQYLANPQALAIAGMRALRASSLTCSGLCDIFVMKGASITLAISDLAAFAQRMTNIAEKGLSGLGARSGENFCEQVPEIEEEVDQILENT